MKVLVLNGSPSGENSITLQTVKYIEKFFPEDSFQVFHVAQKIKGIEKDFSESRKLLEETDLILFCYPVYTFLVPAQLHRFIELMKENALDLSGKAATQISTSKHFYDTTAHRFLQDNLNDMKIPYIRGLSADMEDLLKPKGQKEALDYYRFVSWSMKERVFEPVPYMEDKQKELKEASLPVPEEKTEKKTDAEVVVVCDMEEGEDSGLKRMIERFQSRMEEKVRLVNLRTFPFIGGCLGCFHCASDGTCIYKDGFDSYLRENIQNADAIVYAYTIRDHSMGYRFKLYDDRQFCNGHRTVTMGKPVGYLVDGRLDLEMNLQILMESRAQVGGNFLAGVATNINDPDGEIDRLAKTLSYAIQNDLQMPKNFYGVGGLKIFRDLIYQMRGLMKEDHRFYKAHGFYDFPQKRKGMTLAMYLVGGMMKNKKLSSKMGSKMTEGMILPYKKVMDKADKTANNSIQ